jgi:hypothetical protein
MYTGVVPSSAFRKAVVTSQCASCNPQVATNENTVLTKLMLAVGEYVSSVFGNS